MLMTIPSEGSMSVYNRLYKHGKHGLKIGDIIVARNPMFPSDYACKRVMGLAGDYVVVDGEADVTVGGAVNCGMRGDGGEDAIKEGLEGKGKEPRMVRVPEGHCWLVGDNLGCSRDSRFYGAVPLGLVTGKVVWIKHGSWLDWTFVGGGWTGGEMKVVGKEERVRRGELKLSDEGKRLLSSEG